MPPAWAPVMGATKTGLAEALDSMMWIIQVEYSSFSGNLEIRGYVKPSDTALTEGAILMGFADTMEEILDVLDQGGAELARFPEIVVSDNRDGLEMQVLLEIRDID